MNRLAILDYSRFFAAIAVVLFHYLFNGIGNGKISSITHIPGIIEIVKYGYLGVDLFFMISGYVIFFSANNRKASEFAVSRAVRLYPAFWVAIIFTSFFAYFWGGDKMSVSPSQVIANFTMAAPLFNKGFVDGVYWTLILELQFYLMVFVLLLLGMKAKLQALFLVWPLIIAAALYLGKDHLPYLGGYFCYFSAGAVFAILKNKKSILPYISLVIIFSLCLEFATGKAVSMTNSKGVLYSECVIALVICAFFILFAVSNSKYGSNLKLFGSRLLGELTYPIYLIHAHFGYMFLSEFATEENKIYVYVLTVLIVIVSAFLINLIFEKKLALFWKLFFLEIVGKPIEYMTLKLGSIVSAYGKRK